MRFGSGKRHLYVVLNDPIFDKKYRQRVVVIVNLSSNRDGVESLQYDPACDIEKGVPVLTEKNSCFVLYRLGRIVSAKKLQEQIKEQHETIQMVNDASFRRICKGLEKSDFRPADCWELYKTARNLDAAD